MILPPNGIIFHDPSIIKVEIIEGDTIIPPINRSSTTSHRGQNTISCSHNAHKTRRPRAQGSKKLFFLNHPPPLTACWSIDKTIRHKKTLTFLARIPQCRKVKGDKLSLKKHVKEKNYLHQSSDTQSIGEIFPVNQHFRGHHRHECGDLPADLWKCQIRGLWHIKFFRVYFSEIHQQLFQQFTLKFQDHGNSHRKLTGLWAIRRKSTRRRSFVDKTPRFDLKGTCLSAPPNRCRKHVQLTSCFFSGAGSAYVPGVCW